MLTLLAALSARAQPQASSDQSVPRPTAVYVLVIDHSGSMVEEDKTDASGAKISRWTYMQDLAANFVEGVSLNSRVWIYVFGGYGPDGKKLQLVKRLFPLRQDEDRQGAVQYVRSYASPGRSGTALYDTLAEAFTKADEESDQNPGISIRVMAYTDGEDTHSLVWDSEKLKARFDQLVSKNDNTWLFFTPLDPNQPFAPPFPGEHVEVGTPKHPIPLNLSPSRITLVNPKNSPRQTFKIDLHLSPDHAKLLDGKPARLTFHSDKVQTGPLELVPLKPGPATLTLEVSNTDQLQLDEPYTGKLALTVPEMPRHEVQVTPTDGLAIHFQEAGKLTIGETGPKQGAVFAVGKEIPCFAATLQSATVTWDFGDGAKAVGHQVRHVYQKEGDFNVVVKAVAEGLQDAPPATIPLKIIDIGVQINKPTTAILAGEPALLSCVGHGPVKRYQWSIEGTSLPGKPPTGDTIEYRFHDPGEYPVMVKAISDFGPFLSPELNIKVLPKPTLVITAPAKGVSYHYKKPTEFVALVTGEGIEFVDFSITRTQDGETLLAPPHGHVTVNPENGTATLSHEFHEADTKDSPIAVTATAVLSEGYQMDPPSVEITMSPPPAELTIEIQNPREDGFGLNEPIQLAVVSRSHEILSVDWEFGDGGTGKGVEVNHPYKRHAGADAGYTVAAKVMTKSGLAKRVEKVINLVRKKPTADFALLDAKGNKSLEFSVGDTTKIQDLATGDIGKRVFEVDGRPLAQGRMSIAWRKKGESVVMMKVWDADDPEGQGKHADDRSLKVIVKKVCHICFVAVLCAALGVALTSAWCFTRNGPAVWRVRVSKDPLPAQLRPKGRCEVKKHWSRFFKRAEMTVGHVIKVHNLRSKHWTEGCGRDSKLFPQRVKLGNEIKAQLDFGDKKSSQVTFRKTEESRDATVYELIDSRCPDKYPDDPYRHLYIRLEREAPLLFKKGHSAVRLDYSMILATLVAFAAVVLYAAQVIYFAGP